MKTINGRSYVHRSAINQLNNAQFKLYTKAKKSIYKKFKWDVLMVSNKVVHFVKCKDWDSNYEPVILNRIIYDVKYGSYTYSEGCKSNPHIYHKRHLFVNHDYNGFDIEDDRKRGYLIDSLPIEKHRIGRTNYWKEIKDRYSL